MTQEQKKSLRNALIVGLAIGIIVWLILTKNNPKKDQKENKYCCGA